MKTHLETACKLYNALLHAERKGYEGNKRLMVELGFVVRFESGKAGRGVPGAALTGCAVGGGGVLLGAGAPS